MLMNEETAIEFKFESAHAFVNLAMEGEARWSLNCMSYIGALQLVVGHLILNLAFTFDAPPDRSCAVGTRNEALGYTI